jgi:hypothetical protein
MHANINDGLVVDFDYRLDSCIHDRVDELCVRTRDNQPLITSLFKPFLNPMASKG